MIDMYAKNKSDLETNTQLIFISIWYTICWRIEHNNTIMITIEYTMIN